MGEHPILFSGRLVRALLAGKKTQTRRIVRFPRFAVAECVEPLEGHLGEWTWFHEGDRQASIECPYGAPGDELWVRETWRVRGGRSLIEIPPAHADVMREWIQYGADRPEGACDPVAWKPSIYMPRWASRLTLRITDVRVQRLQEISEEDARAEGVVPLQMDLGSYLPTFEGLWDSINKERGSWKSNPWVWAITFAVIHNPPCGEVPQKEK